MKYTNPKYIMIHHTAVSRRNKPSQFLVNNEYHKAKWRFKSSLGFYLGYNYEIISNGRIFKARREGERTAACYQNNMNDGRCIHICLDGNFDYEKPTPAQIFALRDLLRKLVKKYSINKKDVVFHRQYAVKSCPGKNLDLVFVHSLISPNVIKEASKPQIDNKKQLIKLLSEALEFAQML